MTEFRDEDLFPEGLEELEQEFAKTDDPQVEAFFDIAAWLRDLDMSGLPEHLAVTVEFEREMPLMEINLHTGERKRLEETAPVRFSLQRLAEPKEDGSNPLHAHGPGLCADLNMDFLAEKRPPRS